MCGFLLFFFYFKSILWWGRIMWWLPCTSGTREVFGVPVNLAINVFAWFSVDFCLDIKKITTAKATWSKSEQHSAFSSCSLFLSLGFFYTLASGYYFREKALLSLVAFNAVGTHVYLCLWAQCGRKARITSWFIDSYFSIIHMLNVFRLYKM